MKVYVDFNIVQSHSDPILLQKLANCSFELCDLSNELFEENMVVLDILFGSFPEHRIEDIQKINNKICITMHHGKSVSVRYNRGVLSNYKNFLEKTKFLEKNVFVITQLANDITDLKTMFPDINVLNYDKWLVELFDRHIIPLNFVRKENVYSDTKLDEKKFSLFCRRHAPERLEIYCDLLLDNLLKEFHYTYSNGYNDPIDSIRNAIPEKHKNNQKLINSWIDGIPYAVPTNLASQLVYEFSDYPFELKKYFDYSKIHISMETEPTDVSFITEKTYRAMYYKKPFIMISQVGALDVLRKEGYKTFSPLINETYDGFENYEDRKNAIHEEIKRLNSLSDVELDTLVRRAQPIVEHNYNQLFINGYKPFPENFKFKHMFDSFKTT